MDTTTFWSTTYRTMAPRHLKTMTDSSFTAAYDPVAFSSCLALINVETTVTITYPDGSTLAFYGFLQKFEPDEIKEGEQPTATCTIVATNADPTTGGEEAAVLTSAATT